MRLPRIIALPPLAGHGRLALAMGIDGLGSGFFTPFALLYFTATTHSDVDRIGLVYSVVAMLLIPLGLVAGSIVDRVGPYRVVLAANLSRAMVYGFYPFAHSVGLAAVLIALSGLSDRAYWAAHIPLLANVSHQEDNLLRWVSFVTANRNLGLGLGALGGGLALTGNNPAMLQALVAANAASFLAAFLLMLGLSVPLPPDAIGPRVREGSAGEHRKPWPAVLTDGPYLGLVCAKFMSVLCISAFLAILPVFLITEMKWPGWAAGLTYTANCIAVGLAQSTVTAMTARAGFARVMTAGSVVMSSAGWALLLVSGQDSTGPSPTAALLVGVGVLAFTLAQMIVGPATDALSASTVSDGMRGHYQSVYQLAWSLGLAVAPGAATGLLRVSASCLWGVFAVVALTMVVPGWAVAPGLQRRKLQQAASRPVELA